MADRERLRLPVIGDDEELGVELAEDVLGGVRPVELLTEIINDSTVIKILHVRLDQASKKVDVAQSQANDCSASVRLGSGQVVVEFVVLQQLVAQAG